MTQSIRSKIALLLLSGAMIAAVSAPAASAHEEPITPHWTIQSAVEQMQETWMGGTVMQEEMTGEVREFKMHFSEFDHELTDGVTVKAWGFGLEGEAASVPGPTLRAKEGDLVRITLTNNTDQPHSLHSHGITSLDELNDGVPHVTGAYIMPGESFTYEFVAKESGTHWYHCHVQTSLHQDMGMYGALIIEEKDEPVWDKEFIMMVDEWDTSLDPADPTKPRDYNYFTVNGKSGTSVPDMMIKDGEIARVRLMNAGFETHSLHLHGTHFVVTHKDGYQLPFPYRADTINIAPGETYDLFIKGRDGLFPWHDHNSLNATDDGVYPGGMITHIRGSEAIQFNPEQDKDNPKLPIEGHIHNQSEHPNVTYGDPDFIRQKMAQNSAAWKTASPERRKELHKLNRELGQAIGGVYDTKTGKWTFGAAPAPEQPPVTGTPDSIVNSPATIELGAMKPPVIKQNAVTPIATPGPAVPFDPKAPAQAVKGEVVEVKLEAKRVMMEVAPGDTREVWTFNGSVPTPTIRVHQGDTVRITLVNKDPEMAHGLDFHAGQMDMGTFHQAIKPGESMTFEFQANYPGLFYFHCSAAPVDMHIANGMFGAVIVDPPGYVPEGKEYVVIQNEWYKAGASVQELREGKPVAVALNGSAARHVNEPLTAAPGEKVRFYFINAGINDFSAWHIIGTIFDAIYPDGNPLNKREGVQTVTVAPGGAVITDLTVPDAGTYLMLTHQMNDAMRGGLGYLKVGTE